MMNDVLKTSSVTRLVGLISSRYGKGLSLSFLNDMDSRELSKMQPALVDGALKIPIIYHDKYLGTATIADAHDLSREEHTHICYLVKMILQPVLYNQFVLQKPNAPAEISSQNVIPLFKDFVEEAPSLTRQFETHLIFLESSSELLLHKVSGLIHELSQRWAFIPFHSVSRSVKTPADLASLGEVTLIFSAKDFQEESCQHLILEHAKLSLTTPSPLFIVQSLQPVKEFALKAGIRAEVLDALQKNQIQCDRLPRDLDQMIEALELLLEVREESL